MLCESQLESSLRLLRSRFCIEVTPSKVNRKNLTKKSIASFKRLVLQGKRCDCAFDYIPDKNRLLTCFGKSAALKFVSKSHVNIRKSDC